MGGGFLVYTAKKERTAEWVRAHESKSYLAGAAAFSLIVSVAVLASAVADQSQLGAPTFWPWILTALQVLALWAAGRSLWWGWLLGASVQMPWIAYAIITEQIGFIPGCVVSAMVQSHSFIESASERHAGPDEAAPRRGRITVPRLGPAV